MQLPKIVCLIFASLTLCACAPSFRTSMTNDPLHISAYNHPFVAIFDPQSGYSGQHGRQDGYMNVYSSIGGQRYNLGYNFQHQKH
ncbi:Uncharacterised protein g6673 [Pycnogonum litorale]